MFDLTSTVGVNVINALRDAGIAIAAAIVLAAVFIKLIGFLEKLLLSNRHSDDQQWSDMRDMHQQNMKLQTDSISSINTLTATIAQATILDEKQSKELVETVTRRFDELSNGITHMMQEVDEIKKFIIDTERAEG